MPYSAGTAFLQVVPSFRNVEALIADELRKMGRSIEASVAEAVPNGMRKGGEAAGREGTKAGEDFSGAFANTLQRRLAAAVRSIPKIKIEADSSAFEKAMAQIRSDLLGLRNQKIGVDIDERTALAAVEQLGARLRQLQQDAPEISHFIDLTSARKEVDALGVLAEQARTRGFEAGGNFGGAFGQQARVSIAAALSDLPDIQINAGTSDVERAIAVVRQQLAELHDVHVGVDMDATEFLAKVALLQAQLEELAGHTESIPIQFNTQRAADELRHFAAVTAPAEAQAAAERFVGVFEATIESGLAAAMSHLPEAHIEADATPARAAIGQIRLDLATLSEQHIGIDIDDAAALAEIEFLHENLLRISQEDPSVRVRAETAAAATELAAIIELAHQVDRSDPDINVTTNADKADVSLRSLAHAVGLNQGQLAALIALAPALSAAIVPAAIASAAAVASIGAAALGSIGAAVLGFAGIGTAVKALNKDQQQTAKSSASLSTSQDQVANSLDSVRSAEASLANTRQSSAFATQRAAQQVVDAEKSVADAQRQALQAQEDLTKAREDARRQQQDQAESLKSNALAQRQATLDIADAKAKLDAILTNPRATAAEREQARVTFEERSLQLEQLQIQQQRLHADQDAANKAGIEGSTQVVAAQDRIRTASDAVAQAQQRLRDAIASQQEQQRQSAFQIAQAQQAVISAQRSMEQATVRAGVAGGAAMQNLEVAMDNLSPAGQRFAKFIFSLKPTLDVIRSTAQGGLLPGAEEGIRALLGLEPQVIDSTRRFSTELGDLAAQAGRTFGSPFWSGFFNDLTNFGVPAMDQGYHAAVNLAFGLANLTKIVLPLGNDVGGGLVTFTERFARWSLALENNNGARDFLAYVRVEGPIVLHTISDLVQALAHIAVAVNPIGGVTLFILRALAAVILSIPTPVLTVLAGGALAVAAAMKVWAIAQGALGSAAPAFTAAQLLVGQAITSARTAMQATAPEAGKFATALAGIKGGAQGAAGGLSGLAGMIGPSGLVGIALAGAVIGIGLVTAAIEKQHQRVDALSGAMLRLHDALAEADSVNSQNVKSIVDGNPDLQRAVRLADQYGISTDTLVKSLRGEKSAQAEVTAALNAKIAADEKQFRSFSLSDSGLKQLNNERTLRDALKQTFDQMDANADVNGILDAAQGKTTVSTFQMTEAQQKLGAALNKVKDATATAAEKADALRQADEAIFGGTRAKIQADEDAAAAQDRLTQTLDQFKAAGGDATKALDLNTEAGRQNRRALEDRLTALNNEYFANVAAGQSEEDARAKHDAATKSLGEAAKAAHLNTDEVNGLVTAFGTLPTDPKVTITVAGVQEALTQLEQLEIAQLALSQGIPVDQAAKEWKNQHKAAGELTGGLATGGPVFGPGGPTDDAIPAWLSNGEHVWTAAEVRAAGGHSAVEFLRKLILRGRSPAARFPGDLSEGIAFANGGAVTWPFHLDAKHVKIPTMDEVRNSLWAGVAGSAVTDVQAWLQHQSGKPYIWASAGPFGYDCSGLTSAVWNLLHGKNPYQHTFSTANEANYFPLAGAGGAFTAGWSNAGERGGGSVGHTAGVVGGLPFESRGGVGVVVGKNVTPLSSFAHVGHLAKGGAVHPWLMDQGGMLQPGWNPPIFNGTAGPEAVLTGDQWATMQTLARGGGSGGNTYNFHFLDTTLTVAKLRAIQDRDAAMSRDGRAR